MSVSTDGLLFYGILFEEGEVPEELINELLDDKHRPFALVNYCSGDYPLYALVMEASQKENSRGTPKLLNISELYDLNRLAENWNELFRRFCKQHKLEYKTPEWYLASYWGENEK